MKVTRHARYVAWFAARAEAFAKGRDWMPTNFAPKGSVWHKPHAAVWSPVSR